MLAIGLTIAFILYFAAAVGAFLGFLAGVVLFLLGIFPWAAVGMFALVGAVACAALAICGMLAKV